MFAGELVALGGGVFAGCLSPQQLQVLSALPAGMDGADGKFRWLVLDTWLPEVHEACLPDSRADQRR